MYNEFFSFDKIDFIILLINIQRSDLIRKIPAFLISEILYFADIIPKYIQRTNVSFSSLDNCEIVYQTSHCVNHNIKYLIPYCIRLKIESKDQGWSSYPDQIGSRTSNTWGEISLSCNLCEKYEIFRNIHAGTCFETQETIFNIESKFMTDLRKHCCKSTCNHVYILLYVRSIYPGWRINMKSATIEIMLDLKPNWELLIYNAYYKVQRNY